MKLLNKLPPHKRLPVILYILLTLLLITISAPMMLLQMLLPGFLAVLGAALGMPALIAVLAAGGALCFAFAPNVQSLMPMLTYAPASIALGLLLRRRKSNFTAAAASAAFYIVGVWLILYLLATSSGQSIADFVKAWLDGIVTASMQASPAADPEIMRQMQGYLDFGAAFIAQSTLPLILSAGLCSGILSLTIARRISRSFGAELTPMPPFERWQLPRHFNWGIVILFGGTLVLYASDFQGIEVILSAVQVLILIPLLFQGAALTHYLILYRGMSKAASIVLILLAAAFLPMALIFGGAIELFMHIRLKLDQQRK